MLIKLNPLSPLVRHYAPPVPVERNFDDIDIDAPNDQQIEKLLWIPAVLVAKFMGQFPFLESEADELFSVGVARVAEIVAKKVHAGGKVGAVCNKQCTREMENYINNLDGIVKVSTATRYNNLNKGKSTPSHQGLGQASFSAHTVDSHEHFYLQDACEAFGYNPDDLTPQQQRKLADMLK